MYVNTRGINKFTQQILVPPFKEVQRDSSMNMIFNRLEIAWVQGYTQECHMCRCIRIPGGVLCLSKLWDTCADSLYQATLLWPGCEASVWTEPVVRQSAYLAHTWYDLSSSPTIGKGEEVGLLASQL